MLEPDPLKRPDIYQVSYLAFQLAQRPYSLKNLDVILLKFLIKLLFFN